MARQLEDIHQRGGTQISMATTATITTTPGHTMDGTTITIVGAAGDSWQSKGVAAPIVNLKSKGPNGMLGFCARPVWRRPFAQWSRHAIGRRRSPLRLQAPALLRNCAPGCGLEQVCPRRVFANEMNRAFHSALQGSAPFVEHAVVAHEPRCGGFGNATINIY